MKACNRHDYAVVVYDEVLSKFGCPLCIKENAFSKLEEKFDKLETEYTEVYDEIKELSRIIDAKGLV